MANPAGNSPVPKIRIILAGSIMALVAIVFIAKLFSMQVIDTFVYASRAERISRRQVAIPAQRGEIFDRNADEPVATNVDSFAIRVNPANIPRGRVVEILERLSVLLGIDIAELRRKIPARIYGTYQDVEILTGADLATIATIAERISDFPGVSWHSKPNRHYSSSDSLAHVLGFVGDITQEELQVLFNRGYTANSVIGKSGIERQYDELLRGADGVRFRTVDARGRNVLDGTEREIPPELGSALVLTIDRHVQELAAKALGERIGAAVVMRPTTGEILAMVSYPTFNPNMFYGPGSSSAFGALADDRRAPFLNRAIQAGAPPASTYKVLMTTAVLEEEVFPTNRTVDCTGSLQVGNRAFGCHVSEGHGPLNLFDALAESCNVFFYSMGLDYLGVDTMVDYSQKFGLGERTGIDLPGEVPGLVPNPAWKLRTVGVPWVGGDTVNMSIGQGFLFTTPLQMANLVAMIINNGIVYRPFVVREIRDSLTFEIRSTTMPEVLRQVPIRSSTFADVRAAMRGVITHGTAQYVITTPAVEVAAKTGTAQTGDQTTKHSWFVAFGPYDAAPEDQVVVVVWVDAANEWDWWAPKAADIIFHGFFTGKDYDQTIAELRPWYL